MTLRKLSRLVLVLTIGTAAGIAPTLNGVGATAQYPGVPTSDAESSCGALADIGALSITLAEFRPVGTSSERYCHVRGTIAPGIRYHVDLPLPSRWNGRLVAIGDPGTDGIIFSTNPYIQQRIQRGYAYVNSNSGHDDATEPGASFGFNNRQAEIDFGYRAVHLSTLAAKWIIRTYYGRTATKSYFDGCSTGGRQGLMAAQRFPDDYDGVLAGAPSHYFQGVHVNRNWLMQRMFANDFADNLAFDTDKDGIPEDTAKLNILHAAVLKKCDAKDGITDGVIDDPTTCDFRPAEDLASQICANGVDGRNCFTKGQIQTITDVYRGAHDSRGVRVIKGFGAGSELGWADLIPHAGNQLLGSARFDFVNYLFYENDPGVAVRNPTNISQTVDTATNPPEFAWWQFNIDDVTAGKGKLMSRIIDAADPDLTRFVAKAERKLLIYHGWSDTGIPAETTLDYYREFVDRTHGGDVDRARRQVRLFMVPGMEHCTGGKGPNDWGDRLAPLIAWVENGIAPDFLVARHRMAGTIDNERKICAYPERAVYTGPPGGQNERHNWVAANFSCRR